MHAPGRTRRRLKLKMSQAKPQPKVKSVKGWFPRARQVLQSRQLLYTLTRPQIKSKADPDAKYTIVLFYLYVEPLWSAARQEEAINMCIRVGADLGLGGRIRSKLIWHIQLLITDNVQLLVKGSMLRWVALTTLFVHSLQSCANGIKPSRYMTVAGVTDVGRRELASSTSMICLKTNTLET